LKEIAMSAFAGKADMAADVTCSTALVYAAALVSDDAGDDARKAAISSGVRPKPDRSWASSRSMSHVRIRSLPGSFLARTSLRTRLELGPERRSWNEAKADIPSTNSMFVIDPKRPTGLLPNKMSIQPYPAGRKSLL
jgi:hypothetical protein